MYKHHTESPEEPNRIYLARENSGKPEGTTFCFRRGCQRYVDIPGFKIQRTIDVPCRPPRRAAPAAPPPQELIYGIRYYEVSGFGFPRPVDRTPRTLEQAEAFAAAFRAKQFVGSLESAVPVLLAELPPL